jgi:hypothetical protein
MFVRAVRGLTTLLRSVRWVVAVVLASFAIVRYITPAMRAQGPAGPCGPGGNPIACENSLAGNPRSEWDVAGGGDASIQGFATDISVNHGQTVHFKINTDATSYQIDIYRLGYYAGLGARKVATIAPSAALPQPQPACTVEASTGLIDCGIWSESASWAVPATAVSGIYVARLTRTDSVAGANHIPFIVRDDAGASDVLFQTSDTTWQAYNQFGGNSLYVGGPGINPGRAYKVSYNRPFTTRATSPEDFVFNAEYPMVRWLEANGYNVSYFAGVDGERRGASIRTHRLFMSVGHDEYWSATQRQQVEAARDAGVHLAFFSGNESFWKTRWEPSIDGLATPNRTLVAYKETHANAKIDPDPAWTGTWRDARFSPPADGGRPENGLSGTIFVANDPATGAIVVPESDGKLRLWRGTSVATLAAGTSATLSTGTLGYEWDADLDNGARPAGLFHVSTTTMSLPQVLLDAGSNYGPGIATHNLTMYRAASGALVFGAGTVQWSWGLDTVHDRTASVADVRAQQATVNLLADMGVQPFSLTPGLSAASASTDTSAPTSTITWPTASTGLTKDHQITISGTAADTGGLVAGIEVSVDNGLTWHPAIGRSTWTYAWTPMAAGAVTLMSRAVDDSGNLQAPPASVTVTVSSGCPCTLWTNDVVPGLTDSGDVNAVELGVKFRSDVDGVISGLRFYKSAANTGAHVGNLWSATGTLLATVTFSNETASGWQEAALATPVAITANTVYVASYHTNTAHYSYNGAYFGSEYANAPLRAVANAGSGGNGVYKYGGSAFPDQTYNSANYWVDVVFTAPSADTTPPTVTSVVPVNGALDIATSSAVNVTFSEAMNASTITTATVQLRDPSSSPIASTVSYDGASHTATLHPNAPLAGSTSYTVSVASGVAGVSDLAGNRLATTFTSSFTTVDTTPPSVSSISPGISATNVSVTTNVTVTFNEDMRASSVNTSSFELRDSINQLVTATVAYDVPTRTATLHPNAPLATSATYTAKLNAGAGGVTDLAGNALVTAFTWSFSTVAGADVTPPAVMSVTPAPSATGVAIAATLNATFSEPVVAATINATTFTVRDAASNPVAGSVSYNAGTVSATFTPSSPLAFATVYTATIRGGASGVQDLAGNAMAADYVWSFTTVNPPSGCPCSIWDAAAAPATANANDNNPVELGVKFRATTDGYIHGIRFYKGPLNTGAHVASLWAVDGTLLASATAASETASGWQQVVFNSSVPVTAGVTYIASYHTNVGQYSYTGAYFATAGVDRGPLHAMANGESGPNGVYHYSGTRIFPDQTFNTTNYWVDVVFDTTAADITPPTVVSFSPAQGATNVNTTTVVGATFSEAIDPATITSATMELRDGANLLVSATVSYNATTHVATLTPSAALQSLTTYTVRVHGGASGVKDVAGNALAADATSSFTTRDAVPPVVTSVLPAAGSANVDSGTMVSATFSKPMDATTVSSSTVELRDAANTLVATTLAYDAPSQTVVLHPTAPLAAGTFTGIVKGGSTGVKDQAGNAMASTFSWAFTVGAPPPPVSCPCTLFTSASTPAATATDTNATELGLRFRPTVNGYITALRFYKGTGNTGVHTGSLWTNSGTLLSTVTFSGETTSGWQQMTLPTPIAVVAGTTYVASYHTVAGHYSYDAGYFSGSSVGTSPLIGLADGADGPNGTFKTGASGFPTQSGNGANYWIDAVFNTTVPPDTTAPTVSSTAPANGATNVPTGASIMVTFSESMDPATLTASTVQVRDAASVAVAVALAYDAGTRTVTLTPSSALAGSSPYTIAVSVAAKDQAGNALAAAYSSGFTTGLTHLPPDQGPGGPILVVANPGSPFSRYYAEVLRVEGLNLFQLADLATVSSTMLANFDVVILGETALTSTQATMFSDFVQGGGNLIAMRPDKQLAGLFGLTDAGVVMKDKYLLMNTTAGPGVGLVSQTIQYHGTADLYTLNGAVALATLYSDATTATSNPAVTINTVGLNGGQAVAFTYDLARSIVYTRQGNPAWSHLERDGLTPIRADDLFFGAAAADPQPDWVDLNKVAIPQADEQQRLLANLVEQMNLRKKPLPRFWYLPRGLKAAVVMSGDDHGGGGTLARLNSYKAASVAGCSVADWQCIRSTSYVYPAVPLTDAQAQALTADGFEISLHGTTNCSNYTATSLGPNLADQLALWRGVFPSEPPPTTQRMHCGAWSDYSTQSQVELGLGIRLDTSYYYWPGSWVNDRPGMFTGSGFPMRFTDATGTMIDVYQAATQMTDESGQTYPTTIDALLDNALGPNAYYGVFTANMHNDLATSAGSSAILQSAGARGVPIISARQLLDWVDGRNASSFGSIGWNGNLSFTIAPATGIRGLQAMVPTKPAIGGLDHITKNGNPVTYAVQTLKGIEYAVFAADAGAYVAVYDTTPPVSSITGQPPAFSNSTTAVFSFTANETSTFKCRLDAAVFAACTSPNTLTGVSSGAHTFQVQATDRAGNVEPTPASVTWTVDTVPPTIVSRTPTPGAAGVALNAAIVVQFSEAMNAESLTGSSFRLRKAGAAVDVAAVISVNGATATLTPVDPLAVGGSAYQVTVAGTATDRAGNMLGADSVWTFTTVAQVRDTTVVDFGLGTAGAGTYISATADGEVILGSTSAAEFSGTALPSDWTSAAWAAGGTVTVGGGAATVDGARISTMAMFTPGRSLEFVANFSGAGFQHAGFGLTLNETPWAIFSTQGGGALYARTHNGVVQNNTLIAGSWLGASHLFRIDWNSSSVVFSIDGTQVASHSITIAANMRPIASDLTVGGGTVAVDWMRLTPYASAGSFASRVFDGGAVAAWGQTTWSASLPAGTSLVVSVRTGNTATPDGTWTAFTPIASGASVGASSRYLQYRVDLSTSDTSRTPVFSDITIGGIVP